LESRPKNNENISKIVTNTEKTDKELTNKEFKDSITTNSKKDIKDNMKEQPVTDTINQNTLSPPSKLQTNANKITEPKITGTLIKEVIITPRNDNNVDKEYIEFKEKEFKQNQQSTARNKMKPDLKQIDDNYLYDNYHGTNLNNKLSFEELIGDESKVEIIEKQPLEFNKKKHDALFNLM